ncbi:oligosaccharide flippase family protein [Polaribacter sp. Q13]|uniref:oligosaccharide flippase family protein n=1 Tax=Polaribacter sp. Q13 TaxID=2806551 RepID=UPI00193AF413|nr:oligosaccharide flippase family protein [Polaribacter sp. Q13]QVY65353.1 oligosaccharide flippase family protein [Polaribacter sp. Q13]
MFRGTIIAQIIAVIGTVFLAKMYGEEAYGFFGVFISIVGIVSIITTLQLDKCIIIAKDKNESINWYNFLLILIPFLSIFIILILLLTSNYFFEEKLSIHIIFISIVGALLFAYNLVNESFFTFKKEFSTISNARVFFTISNVALQMLLYSFYNLLGLIIGFLISQLLLLVYYLFRNKSEFSIPNFRKIRKGINSNASIVKYLLPSNTINGLATNLMPILILSFFGAKEAGVYFFSIKILGTPLSLISTSISQVFFQKSSELFKENKNELYKLTKRIVRTNLIIMFGFLVLINTIGLYILELYLGEKWLNLKTYTLILSILIFARASFNPISSLIVVLNKNLESLIFNSYLFVINIIAIYVGYFYSDITITIIILAIFGGIGYLVLLAYFLNHLKQLVKNNV